MKEVIFVAIVTNLPTTTNLDAPTPVDPTIAPPMAPPVEELFCNIAEFALHLKVLAKIKDQYPAAIIVSDDFLKHCSQATADRFLKLILDRDPACVQHFIEVNAFGVKLHTSSNVSDLKFQNIIRHRPRP